MLIVELPFSKNRIRKLGERLAAGPGISDDDSRMLEQIMGVYGEALDAVKERLESRLGLSATGRLKNTGTIVEKLRRQPRLSLHVIQDIAGTRVVLGITLGEQMHVVREILRSFGASNCRHTDRCADPRSGYRAQHVIVSMDGIPVEIQIRTALQDLWAQIFERLADLPAVGRGVRYGEPPADPAAAPVVRMAQDISGTIADLEVFKDQVGTVNIELQLRDREDPQVDVLREDMLVLKAQVLQAEKQLHTRLLSVLEAVSSGT